MEKKSKETVQKKQNVSEKTSNPDSFMDRIRFAFVSMFNRPKKREKVSDMTDDEYNEITVLRYVLLKSALNSEELRGTIKGSFGLDVSTEEIENKLAMTLLDLIKQHNKSIKQEKR